MKDLVQYINESMNSPQSYKELIKWLEDNNYEFTTEDDDKNNTKNIIIKTKYDDVTIVLSFLGSNEFLYDVNKGDDTIMYDQSSHEINKMDIDTIKRRLDPIEYFNHIIAQYDKKLKSLKKGKMNRRTGERNIDTMNVSRCERMIAKAKQWISKIK